MLELLLLLLLLLLLSSLLDSRVSLVYGEQCAGDWFDIERWLVEGRKVTRTTSLSGCRRLPCACG